MIFQKIFIAALVLASISLNSSPLNAAESRPFKLAATAVQMVPLSSEPFRNGTPDFHIATMAPDVDVVTIWPEYLGIPYDVFALGPNIPESHPWVIKMNELITAVQAAGRPIMLELGLVRTGMVAQALDNNGQLLVDDAWAPTCYDFTQPEAVAIGDAYVNYVQWMTTKFQPAYVVNFIEANLYYSGCGGATESWDELVNIQQRAYSAAKELRPETPVFPSFHLETLYGYYKDGWDELQYNAISAMQHDRFGLSAYPFGITRADGHLISPYDLPMDYIVRTMLRHPSEQLVIAETGWNNTSITIGDPSSGCIENFPYSEEQWATDYLGFVFASAHYGQFDIVNWWSFRDEMPANVLGSCFVRDNNPYAACSGEPWCMVTNYMKEVTYQGSSELFSELVLKAFGAMGLMHYDGTPRSLLLNRWTQEMALPIN